MSVKEIMGLIGLDMDVSKLVQSSKQAEKVMNDAAKTAKKADEEIAASAEKKAARVTAADKKIIESAKQETLTVKAASKERERAADVELENAKGLNIERRKGVEMEKTERATRLQAAKNVGNLALQNAKIVTKIEEGEQRRRTLFAKQQLNERAREESKVRRVLDRTILAPEGTRERVLSAIGGAGKARQRSAISTFFGLTPQEQILGQLSQGGFGRDEAQFLSGVTSKRPTSLEGPQLAQQRSAKEYERTWQVLLKDQEKEEAKYVKARNDSLKQSAKINAALMREGRREEQKIEREALNERKRAIAANAKETHKESQQMNRIITRSLTGPEGIQQQVIQAVRGFGPAMQRRQAMAGGATLTQAFQQNLIAAGLGQQNAAFLVGAGGRRPPTFGGTPPRIPRGGFLGGAGGLLRGAGAALGIGVGAYAVGSVIRGGLEDVGRATAYERQRIAAEHLAGSQAKLNELLAEYEESSGGAVNKATTLANVTRLLATGFAETVPELEKFVRATRGASIALGKPQDYVIQETQLAISNTSFKRLDQIGIGISEVNDRIDELRKNNRNLSREEAFQTAVMDIMSEKYAHLGDTMEGQASGVEKLTKAWSDFRLELGKSVKGPIDAFADYFAKRLKEVTAALDEAHQDFKEAQDFQTFLKATDDPTKPVVIQGPLAGLTQGMLASQGIPSTTGSSKGFSFPGAPPWMASVQAAMGTKSVAGNEEDVAKIRADYYQRFEDLEKQTGEQRLQVIEEYEQQREQIIISYGKNVVREEQDFARQRARSQRDFERSIQDMAEDAAEREADWQEDLDEKIADLREDANDKLEDVEKKYQKDRERSEKDHRERLMKAAGQLDAIGVLEERKRWRREQSEREEDHKEQVEELRENLQEQIDEAKEAHAERLEDAREADAKRLEDMRTARTRQLADEDEDRAIRLARAAEDHQDQLNALDAQHALRLQQIATNAAEERDKLEKAFEDSLYEVGHYVKGLHEKVMAEAKIMEDWFDNFIDHMERRLAIESDPGRYRLDETGRPIIPLDYGSQLGGVSSVSSINNSGGNKSVVISQGAIVVYSSGDVAGAMGDTILDAIVQALEKY